MSVRQALTSHWPEYLIEALGLCVFMISACSFVSLVEYPASSVRQAVADPLQRRALVGLAMGLTAVAIIYSPWGMRSGAHLNPALTTVYALLGKVAPRDALFYIAFQFMGGIAGVLLARTLLGDAVVGSAAVHYVVTRPGVYGTGAAFAAEFAISFGLMTLVLTCSNRPRYNRYTGLFAGGLIALYITFEAPLSGMSMNPARSLGSAVSAREWGALWVYFSAPLAGMLLAAVAYCRTHGGGSILCCKLHHDNGQRCIFRCRYHRGADVHSIHARENTMNTTLNPAQEIGVESLLVSSEATAPEPALVCPACGGENPHDAVFCGNPSCHKALGEFRYVLEEIGARKNWLERLADRVALFVSKPHFIIFHVAWFVLWIMLNQGGIGPFAGFDDYPYDLLSFILAIEAILVTGFLLISQNYQYEYSEKRAELDYEINIRAYRKLLELEKRLEALSASESRANRP